MQGNQCKEGQRLSELLILRTIELNKVEFGGRLPAAEHDAAKADPTQCSDAKIAFNRAFWERTHHLDTCPVCRPRTCE